VATLEQAIGVSDNQHVDFDEDPAIIPWGLEAFIGPLTLRNLSVVSTTMAAQNAPLCSGSNNSETHILPPLHDVAAFHAHAHVVEVPAPDLQWEVSHHAEILCTSAYENREAPASSQDSTVDLEFLSFSSLFSSQHDTGLRPLELTSLSPAAESVRSLSQPMVQGASLARRPATKRKGSAYPHAQSTPIPPHLNKSRKTSNLGRKASGILRAINSSVLNKIAGIQGSMGRLRHKGIRQ
jgi:hypothetical protein